MPQIPDFTLSFRLFRLLIPKNASNVDPPGFNVGVLRPQDQREPPGGGERPAEAVPAQGVLPEDRSAGTIHR